MAAFHKMSGSGNDFVFLDGRTEAVGDWTAPMIRDICDRREGVGADGLVVLEPGERGVVRMHYFNADGGRAEMCGNAALCSTRMAVRLGIAEPSGLHLQTDAGTITTRCVGPGDMAEIELGTVPVPADVNRVPLEAGERRMAVGVVGVPHLVVLVDDIDAVPVATRGRDLRRHAAFAPRGVNANFVAPPADGAGPWQIRTYERGVEAETLACGTGTVAAALALAAWGRATLPLDFVSRGGAPLAVSGSLDGSSVTGVWLCGQGRVTFTGTWTPRKR